MRVLDTSLDLTLHENWLILWFGPPGGGAGVGGRRDTAAFTFSQDALHTSAAENERLYEGKTGPHRAHYEKQAGAMMKREDRFHVEPSLMSNGPIITGECKQEKTLHTDTGWVMHSVVCCGLCGNQRIMCVPSLVAALPPTLWSHICCCCCESRPGTDTASRWFCFNRTPVTRLLTNLSFLCIGGIKLSHR